MNRNNPSVIINKAIAKNGKLLLKKLKEIILSSPNKKAVTAIVLYPSLCIVIGEI